MLKLEKELNNFEDTCDCYQIRHVSVKVWIKVKGGKQIAVSAQRYRDGSHFLLLKRWQQSVTHSGSSFYGLIKRNKWEDNNNVWIQSLRLENFRRINIKIYILFRYVSASRYWAKSPEMDLTNAMLVTADWFMESFSINQLKKKKMRKAAATGWCRISSNVATGPDSWGESIRFKGSSTFQPSPTVMSCGQWPKEWDCLALW